ncbi:hypothetical protein [Exiguobacterium sp. s193]|uniref:hypothetical protein n=1 Tax=Exiguobacterium sp. s193 TaxID=2751207 RepID=UPI001BE888C5|nr:hypothetical protein [Exiguobacterium sp. s193]
MNLVVKELIDYFKSIFDNDPHLIAFFLCFSFLFIWLGNQIKQQQNDSSKKNDSLLDDRVRSCATILNEYRESQLNGNYSPFFKSVYDSLNVLDKKVANEAFSILESNIGEIEKGNHISKVISTRLKKYLNQKEDGNHVNNSLFSEFESIILSTFKIIHPYGISLTVLIGILLTVVVSSNSTSYPEMFIRILSLIFICCFILISIDLISEKKLSKSKFLQILLGFIFCTATLITSGLIFWIFAVLFIRTLIWIFMKNEDGMFN